MSHNHHKSRRTAAQSLFNFAGLLQLGATIAASYIGAQNRADLERVKADNLRLKNQIEAQKVGKIHNDVLLGDLTIEKRILEIEKLKRELGISAGTFEADSYPDPGNIREEERKKS